MSELINALSNPAGMSQAQWLVIAIAAFIIIASLYFVWKLFKLVKIGAKSTYQPKIGLSRTGYSHARKAAQAAAKTEADLDQDKVE